MNNTIRFAKKTRRIISLVLISVLMLSLCGTVSAADAGAGYSFVQSLGAIPEDIASKESITKGEFVGILCNVLYKELSKTTTEAPFIDVPADHKYAGAVALMKSMGAVNGDLYGKFNPDLYITPSQAVTVLVKALGYNQYAEAKGGYPTGYLYIAKLNGITRNLTLAGDYVSLSDAAEMIYNALFSFVVVLDRIEDGEPIYTIDGGTTVMSEFLNIEKLDGVVIADSMTCVSGTHSAGDGQVRIKEYNSGKIYTINCDNPAISGMLGMRINAFIYTDEKTGENRIVYFEANNNVKVTEILSDDIINTYSTSIEYETDKESGKTKTVNFSGNGATVVLNGIRTATYSPSDLKPQSGKVVLIDNNSDSKPEYVMVYKYTGLIITEKVSAADKFIASKLSAVSNIDYSNENTDAYYIEKDGACIDFEDILPNDVINVAKSASKVDGKYITYLFVSSQTLSGNVTSYSADEMLIYIDEAEYKVSGLFKQYKPSLFSMLSVNSPITVYIDSDGKVSYIDGGRVAGTYHYIINMYNESSFEGNIRLMLYTDLSAFSEPVISDNVVIDGKRLDGKLQDGTTASRFDEIRELLSIRPDRTIDYLTAEEAAAFNKKLTNINPRPAKIRFNAKGEVINIDTDAPNYAAGEEALEELDAAALKPGRRDFRAGRFNNTLGTVDGSYYITAETVVLKVADVDRYGLPSQYKNTFVNPFEQDISDITNYRVMRRDQQEFVSPGGYTYYDMQGYDIDPDTGSAGLVIVRGFSDYMGYQSLPVAVFDKVTEVYDSKNETITTKIYYYVNGVETSAVVNKDKLHPYVYNAIYGGTQITKVTGSGTTETPTSDGIAAIEPLKQGDVVTIITDSDGYVSWVWKDVDISDINSKPSATARPLLGAHPYRAGLVNGSAILQSTTTAASMDLSGSYTMLLGVARSVSGMYARVDHPYTISTTYGSEYGAPIGNILTDSKTVFRKVFNLGNSARYTLVEEIECNSHTGGECKFRVGEGTINDIKGIDSFATEAEGLKKASRLYTYSSYGSSAYVVIMNLNENHDM